MPTTPESTSLASAADRLVELGMLRGRVLVIGPAIAEAVVHLRQAGIEAEGGAADAAGVKRAAKYAEASGVTAKFEKLNPLRLPEGRADAVLDLGVFASAPTSRRSAVLAALGRAVPPLGTVFLAGSREAGSNLPRFTPADVRAAVDRDGHRVFPAVNFSGPRGAKVKGLVVPVQRVAAPVPEDHAAGSSAPTTPDWYRGEAMAFAATREAVPFSGGGNVVQRQMILTPGPIVALQKCDSWCWAAALQMLCRSQGFDVDQETFVKKVFGVRPNGQPPCVMSGPLENMKRAIDGTVGTVGGDTLTLTSTVRQGVPEGAVVREQVDSLLAQKPYVFGFDSHAYVCYGVTWQQRADGTGPIQINRLELIDPFPTRQRLTFINFPTNIVTLSKIHGLLLLNVSKT